MKISQGAFRPQPAGRSKPLGHLRWASSPHRRLKPGPGRPAEAVAANQRARLRATLIELVAERGYEAVTVSELVQWAGVSKRDYYRHFAGKEECFLSTYDFVVRQAAKGILAATATESDWDGRLQIGYQTLSSQLEENPGAAQLALVDAFDVGPVALERMRTTEGLFVALVSKSLSSGAGGARPPSLLLNGIVAGACWIARMRLLEGRTGEPTAGTDQLLRWTLSLCEGADAGLLNLNRRPPVRATATRNQPAPDGDERAIILAAAARLAMREGYRNLTVPRIRAAAGVSKRSFHEHFEDVSDCFLAASDLLGARVLAEAQSECDASDDEAAGLYRTIAALCSRLAQDPVLAKLVFLEVFAAGSEPLRRRGDLTVTLGDLLRPQAELHGSSDELATEASVGAIWGVIHRFVAAGHTSRLPSAAPILTFLALAPAIGGPAACQVIEAETGSAPGVRSGASS